MTTGPTNLVAMPELLMPAWIEGTSLAQVWLEAYIDTGSGALAIEAVRRDPDYDQYFAGNRRDDGSLRWNEAQYLGIVESYEDVILSVNVNPDLFRNQYSKLIAGMVSADELAFRVNNIYERILESTDEIQAAYAAEFALDMSTEAIVASVLDPDVGTAILTRQIALSEVVGSAAAKNFGVSQDFASELLAYGVDDRGEAQQFFAGAENVIPTIGILAARHDDPDDDFDLNEFAQATVFGDPEQRRRMRRLMAQEQTSFGADRGLTITRSESGALTGLVER